ncbi:MAG: hypothetical protein KIT11_08830 [Fimbriimonadaceae bacterium]|nr:hypothetical protein [Fimbriimonadaceae bacterium]QYK55431.1 MAG: hypothetical protein KF733_10500 [Fimbriimonadaceae bacterium]
MAVGGWRLAALWLALNTAVLGQAGYYKIEYSGGTWRMQASGSPDIFSDSYNDQNPTGRYGAEPHLPFNPGWTDCTGTITATVTWMKSSPTDEPPPAIVIGEYCRAAYDHSGAANNGLGDPEVNKVSEGSRWSVKYKASSFTLTVSPSPNDVTANYPDFPFCEVWYKPYIYPIDIDFDGVQSGSGGNNDYCLVGQEVVATLTKGGLPDYPDDTYQWAISGGRLFAAYSAWPNSATITPYVPGIAKSTTCYFSKLREGDFTCQTFIGGPVQKSLTITRTVTLEKPTPSQVSVGIGTPQKNMVGGDLRFRLFGGLAPWGQTLLGPAGIIWAANPCTPAVYDGVGRWQFVQKLIPARHIVQGGVPKHLETNGIDGLDTSYPFSGPYYSSIDPVASFNWTGDSPWALLEPHWQPPITQSRIATESFKAYVMYKPPQHEGLYGVHWVALKEFTWYWGGSVSRSLPTDPWGPVENGAAQWSYTADFPVQPTWSFLHTTGATFVP